jgi:Leucine-rich repeat (LRR) protein
MILKKCFLINLLAVLAVSAVCVGAADVTLIGTCNSPTQLLFNYQTVGASDNVRDITISSNQQSCNASSVTEIWFQTSSFYYIPALLFTTFPNAQILNILKVNLREIRPNTFQNATKLTKLWFSSNGFTNLNASSFAGATALQELRVSEYNFTVNPNTFKGLPALKYVEFYGVMLTIDQTLFADSSKLKTLVLQLCSIKSIDLRSLTSLEELNLSHNGLSSLNKNLLQNNSKLTAIDFSNNQLSALDDGFFKNNPNLLSIYLYYNQLENITDALFANTPLLQTLHLSGNKIKSLSSTVFQKLPNLRALYLSYNLLTSLPKNLFSNNTGLRALILDSNKLNAIYQNTFSNLKSLEFLYLKNNTCINVDFAPPINSSAVMKALAKCDANANTCPTNNNSFLKEQLKTAATMLANVASILVSITSKL